MRYRLPAAMSFEEFQERLGEMLDELPAPLLEDLNGGVVADLPGKVDEHGIFILGQYRRDPYLGRLVAIYYGSFSALYGRNRRIWLREMRKTLRHEIRHHVEGRAGLRDLEREDVDQLRRFLERDEPAHRKRDSDG